MKKKPFLLLEILIAFFLVSLCIVPLVRRPLELFRSELKQLEAMEKERLADWAFTEVKEMLLKNEIPWAKFPEEGAITDKLLLKDAYIQLPGRDEKVVKRAFTLKTRKVKPGKDGIEYRQIGVYIYLGSDVYEFRLPVKKTHQIVVEK